ncbi:MAG: methionine synthase [Bacteroidales bacterium]|nr:methionine synthase [Bacteroidales bacterium]
MYMTDLEHRILILDGAMGTMIQRYGLAEDDYRCGPFSSCTKELRGNNECLNLTHPEIIKAIHKEYIAAGADIIETNTFSANVISQREYGCEDFAEQMAYEGARIAREAADEAAQMAASVGLERKVWVAGSMGPTSKSLSLSPDVSDPAFRPYSFDQMKEAYRAQAEALLRGGADILLIETCFDALNVKAALAAIKEIGRKTLMTPLAPSQPSWAPPPSRGWQNASSIIQPLPAKATVIPVMISVSVGDRSGRTLTGQTLEAFYTSVRHYPIMSFGLNCSLGAAELTPLVEDMNRWCGCAVSCYPNAGLPNEMGGYDQSPEEMASQVREMASRGLINIAGGCCGTTPDHIRAISKELKGIAPRQLSVNKDVFTDGILKVSGLEAVTVDVKTSNFTNVGERTNVAGSRKFARLISEGKYEEALQIAAKQIEDGAAIIDINMDDAMLDSTREMERFVRYISNDPAVAKAALMIDSSHWETLIAGLKNAQGKCIVNSISLKEGPESFIQKAKAIKSFGASMVVMAFDEQGQATTYERKIEICERAYRLLTEEAGISPEDIIFDVNILSIGTGIEEHARYAIDFIEAVRWIKANLKGALTSGGVSNLSFAFRGNNPVREAMHSAFLYHAIKAGLDMAIVNPSMLQIYDEIDPQLLRCVEDVIFDRDPAATERLMDYCQRQKEMADQAGHDERCSCHAHNSRPARESLEERLRTALVKGTSATLDSDLKEAMERYTSALEVIEGPLMAGMETVGKLFGEGKMFLPQVVKSAKVMRDAVSLLEPYMSNDDQKSSRPKIVIATVKGDVHDIGKNITGIVLTCNGFDVHDLGVMVDKETILEKASELHADIIAVSGLITPSLYQMEEICREMASRGMDTPLFVGGATTSSLHTAVKLAPLYAHVFHGADASAAAVMAKKCMMDRKTFEAEQHAGQDKIRSMYDKEKGAGGSDKDEPRQAKPDRASHCSIPLPSDIAARELSAEEVMQYFDWKMFYAIWGVKYGSVSAEAMELMQLRQDAEEELALGNFIIKVSARFMEACTDGKDIITGGMRLPMLRQEGGDQRSLSDFIVLEQSEEKSPLGMFTICVKARNASHEEGCCCPACSNKYEDLIAKTVRMTLAEAASKWLDKEILRQMQDENVKVIKPAAGYASCPDHTMKKDIMDVLSGRFDLEIKMTESYAMIPEASICGLIIMHPEARYHEIRRISREQYDDYAQRRGMNEATARRFLGHLLK